MPPLIDAAGLHGRLAAGERIVLLDVRWVLGRTDGRERYLEGHLPGAVFVDLPTELADHAQPALGRHPLPSTDRFQEAARRWGINESDTVVAYDDSGSMAAARVWWMLRDAGVASVYLLDGGLSAWRAEGHLLETGEVSPGVGNLTLAEGRMPVISGQEAAHWHGDRVLLDARAGERYRGEVEPVDPRAGHIPGAFSAPTTDNISAAGTFLPAEELRARFAGLGVTDETPVAVYCGSGVTAAHQIVALELAGFKAALFPGSFSQWSNDAGNPVATGPEPFEGEPATAGTGRPQTGTATGAGGSVEP